MILAERTQVAIIGAGPAGMVLAHLLAHGGVDARVIERRDRAGVEGRVRAGVLEHGSVDLLRRLGLGARLDREGLTHGGICLSDEGEAFRVDLTRLTGVAVTVYGQGEVMRDLFDAADARGVSVTWEAADVELHDLAGDAPRVTWRDADGAHELACDHVVACDGFHGVGRQAIPATVLRTFERAYPFGWLGVLADVPPCGHELIYASHERGFALASMRSPARSRYYVQVAADERVEDWPDERFWDELCVRLGPAATRQLTRAASFDKAVAPLRSFVAEPMRWGRLFLAGDAAHIVPPTGAKGMNLAVSDAALLADALVAFHRCGDSAGLDGYSARALRRVWKAERFSWWFTALTHRFPDTDRFGRRLQRAEFDYLRGSEAAQRSLAENYVGLPWAQAA